MTGSELEHRPPSNGRRSLFYVVVPLTVTSVLVAMYFSGVQWLQSIVSPLYSRELGLLENLQHVTLLAVVWIFVCGARRKPARAERVAFGALAAFAFLFFLEEVDYGLHLIDEIRGKGPPTTKEIRNLHNIGSTGPLKRFGDVLLTLFFVVAPLVFGRSRRPLARYLVASRFAIATIVIMVVLSRVAHYLQDTGDYSGSISANIAEFRELNIYYLVLIYAYELIFLRSYSPNPPP